MGAVTAGRVRVLVRAATHHHHAPAHHHAPSRHPAAPAHHASAAVHLPPPAGDGRECPRAVDVGDDTAGVQADLAQRQQAVTRKARPRAVGEAHLVPRVQACDQTTPVLVATGEEPHRDVHAPGGLPHRAGAAAEATAEPAGTTVAFTAAPAAAVAAVPPEQQEVAGVQEGLDLLRGLHLVAQLGPVDLRRLRLLRFADVGGLRGGAGGPQAGAQHRHQREDELHTDLGLWCHRG